MKKIVAQFLFVSIVFAYSLCVQANQFCFASAKTYYEQVYCELEAKGKIKNLPSFEQFKHNNEMVQASLLKIPAERNGITLPPPKKTEKVAVEDYDFKDSKIETPSPLKGQVSPPRPSANTNDLLVARKIVKLKENASTTNCQMQGAEIHCESRIYRLIGNKTNAHLREGVLLDTNKMALPLFQQDQSIDAYVTAAYRQYIEKMCEIGLGGVTMTYTRFGYLYEDLLSKNVNFVKRFEIMYSFLKKDKSTMWVSEKIPVNTQLAMQYCDLISAKLYVCAALGQNYIFELQR